MLARKHHYVSATISSRVEEKANISKFSLVPFAGKSFRAQYSQVMIEVIAGVRASFLIRNQYLGRTLLFGHWFVLHVLRLQRNPEYCQLIATEHWVFVISKLLNKSLSRWSSSTRKCGRFAFVKQFLINILFNTAAGAVLSRTWVRCRARL